MTAHSLFLGYPYIFILNLYLFMKFMPYTLLMFLKTLLMSLTLRTPTSINNIRKMDQK